MSEKFSIWIIPPKETRDKLSKIINQLSVKYNSPRFTPHITIIPVLKGDVQEIKSKINKLSETIEPFMVKLDELNYGNYFWKAVFIEVIKDEPIDKLYRTFHDSFEDLLEPIESHLEFVPHISLIYADFDQKVKLEIIETLKQLDLKFEFRADGVSLTSMKSTNTKDWSIVKNFKFKAFAT